MSEIPRFAGFFLLRHDNVLRAYGQLDCSDEYRRLNFQETLVDVVGPNGSTREEHIVRMTKDGLVFLAMGFRGKQVVHIKEAYINAFNAMADQLQQTSMSLWNSTS